MGHKNNSDNSKLIKAQCAEHSKTMSAMLNASEDLVFFLDRKYRITGLNNKAIKRLGGPRKFLIGKSVFKFLSASMAKKRKAFLDKVLSSKKPVIFEDINNGRLIRNSIYPVLGDNGNVEKLVIYSRDITDIRLNQSDSKYYSDCYRSAIESSRDGLGIVDKHGKFLDVNTAACRLSGLSKKELLNTTAYDLDISLTRRELQNIIKEVIKKGYLSFEIIMKHKKGYDVDLLVTDHAFKIDGQDLIFCHIRDITETKMVQSENDFYREKLSELQKNILADTLGSMLTHQINQPLTTLNLIIPEIMEKVKKLAKDKETLDKLKDCLNHTKTITSIVNSFRRITQNKTEISTGKINIPKILERAVKTKLYHAGEKRLNIQLNLPKMLPKGYGSEHCFEQVFAILIQNAIDAADGKLEHRLIITAKAGEHKLLIKFQDDCGGIHPDIMAKIFEPFFTTKSSGMGLGLPIVHKITSICGGAISVDNKFGHGICFNITIPFKKTCNCGNRKSIR